MSRYKDNKGRCIAPKIAEKTEKQTTNPPTHTNSSKIRAKKILRRESSKVAIETTIKETKSETIVQIESIIQHARGEALVTQSEGARKETEVAIEEVASFVGESHKTLEHLDTPYNPVFEPSLSWEDSPPPYKLFGDMAEE
jgi:hypothetical protein